ncbi:hypothetical protein [Roseomonas sp. BN140053]|uniref:hypothetical protein n=1 Tax=Roseomonas sp. BN140053 TaxID=3391898 RepID=UPI0039ECD7C2
MSLRQRRPAGVPLLALLAALLPAIPAAAQPSRPPTAPGATPAQPAPPGTRPPGNPAPDPRRAELDRLLDQLARAPDTAAAAPLETRIRALWAQGASPAVVLLLRRAGRNMEARQAADAVEDLDAAITLQPNHADSWVLRAQAQAAAGDPRAGVRDLQEALRLEPRHFGALLALSSIQDGSGDLSGALRSLEAALRLHPKLAGGEARLRDLRRRALGDNT